MQSESTSSVATLLSQVLVAFTIEFDNEFEHRSAHRTTSHGSTGAGPWLASLVMWSNCMQFIGEDGVRVGELERLARTKTNLKGMERWGYIVIEPDLADSRPKSPPSNWLIRATRKGRKAQEIWRPLFQVIEKRWETRFGEGNIKRLRESLLALVNQFELELPDCLPILKYGLFSVGPDHPQSARNTTSLPLAAILSRALLTFATEFERESELSLAICANVLRVLNETGVPLRDVAILSGVSKESISMAMGVLQKKGVAVIAADPKVSRTKVVGLTPKGLKAQARYYHLLGVIQARWAERFGKETIDALQQTLQDVINGPLLQGLQPYPDGWRAKVRKAETLPHYPMVLHRGGYPDGS